MHPQLTPEEAPTFNDGRPHYVVDQNGCWLWQGALTAEGYGRIWINRIPQPAHCYYYRLHVGPIPPQWQVHHLCRVRWCVNPAHLQALPHRSHALISGHQGILVPKPARRVRQALSAEVQRAVAERRFWSHVEKTDTCWLYTSGPSQPKPQFWLNGRAVRASRLAYEWYVGPIAAGLYVCHTCDTPRCVRPDHLWLGTCAENHADRNRKGRQARGERNGMRTHPESVLRGEAWSRAHPLHTLSRGTTHPAHLHPETRQGERNGRAILNAAQVVEIYTRYRAGGITVAALARSYNVTWSTIKYIVSGRHWRQVLAEAGLIPAPEASHRCD